MENYKIGDAYDYVQKNTKIKKTLIIYWILCIFGFLVGFNLGDSISKLFNK